jgi:hypothetical protein
MRDTTPTALRREGSQRGGSCGQPSLANRDLARQARRTAPPIIVGPDFPRSEDVTAPAFGPKDRKASGAWFARSGDRPRLTRCTSSGGVQATSADYTPQLRPLQHFGGIGWW